MLPLGGRAPEFTLPDQDEQSVSLSNLLRRGPLILYFYPADFTPGCTREACLMRDLHGEIEQAGLNVAGVSPQPPATHRRFREKYQLPFTLLTLGLFIFLVNAVCLVLAAWVVPGFEVHGFWTAVFGSVFISLVSWILSALIVDRRRY